MRQLVINFLEDSYPSFDSFLGSSNQELLSILKSEDSKLVYVWGTEGIGKSHLLKAWLKHHSQAKDINTILISKDNTEYLNDFFEHQYQFIAIDDIHNFNEEEQIRLFHLFNQVLDSNCQLLISSESPPQQLLQLRSDLRTRLGLCLIYEVYPMQESEKIAIMKEYISIRQTNISDDVLNYLISHMPRNLNFLLNTLKEIDNFAINNQRKITIPLVKKYLQEHQQ